MTPERKERVNMSTQLVEALRELVALEADGKHADEGAIEAWERARAALADQESKQPLCEGDSDCVAHMHCREHGCKKEAALAAHEPLNVNQRSALYGLASAQPSAQPPAMWRHGWTAQEAAAPAQPVEKARILKEHARILKLLDDERHKIVAALYGADVASHRGYQAGDLDRLIARAALAAHEPAECVECGGPLQWRCPACKIAQSEAVAQPAQQEQR